MKLLSIAKNQWPTANALFIVAAIQSLLGALYGWFYWPGLGGDHIAGWLFVFSGIIYLALALAVPWIKRFSLLLGVSLYLILVFAVHPIPSESGTWQDGLFLRTPVLGFLLWGLLAGNDWVRPRTRMLLLCNTILILCFGFGIQYALRHIIGSADWLDEMRESLKGAARTLPPQTRMLPIVNIFCEAETKAFELSILAGIALGFSIFGFCVILLNLIRQLIKVRTLADPKPQHAGTHDSGRSQ